MNDFFFWPWAVTYILGAIATMLWMTESGKMKRYQLFIVGLLWPIPAFFLGAIALIEWFGQES